MKSALERPEERGRAPASKMKGKSPPAPKPSNREVLGLLLYDPEAGIIGRNVVPREEGRGATPVHAS